MKSSFRIAGGVLLIFALLLLMSAMAVSAQGPSGSGTPGAGTPGASGTSAAPATPGGSTNPNVSQTPAAAPPASASGTTKDDPAAALDLNGNIQSLAPNAAEWLKFNYTTNGLSTPRPNVTIRLLNGVQNGLNFEVWSPERMQGNWYDNKPVGRGSQETLPNCTATLPDGSTAKCTTNDLVWSGGFGADGTYFIRIINNGNNNNGANGANNANNNGNNSTTNNPNNNANNGTTNNNATVAPQLIISGSGLANCNTNQNTTQGQNNNQNNGQSQNNTQGQNNNQGQNNQNQANNNQPFVQIQCQPQAQNPSTPQNANGNGTNNGAQNQGNTQNNGQNNNQNSAGAPSSSGTNSNLDNPGAAMDLSGNLQSLAPNSAEWIKFNYNTNSNASPRPTVTIRLVNGAQNGLNFEVWSNERLQATSPDNKPVGRGSQETIPNCNTTAADGSTVKCTTNDLVWTGGFGTDGTYYVRIVNSGTNGNNAAVAPQLIFSGSGLANCSAPSQNTAQGQNNNQNNSQNQNNPQGTNNNQGQNNQNQANNNQNNSQASIQVQCQP